MSQEQLNNQNPGEQSISPDNNPNLTEIVAKLEQELAEMQKEIAEMNPASTKRPEGSWIEAGLSFLNKKIEFPKRESINKRIETEAKALDKVAGITPKIEAVKSQVESSKQLAKNTWSSLKNAVTQKAQAANQFMADDVRRTGEHVKIAGNYLANDAKQTMDDAKGVGQFIANGAQQTLDGAKTIGITALGVSAVAILTPGKIAKYVSEGLEQKVNNFETPVELIDKGKNELNNINTKYSNLFERPLSRKSFDILKTFCIKSGILIKLPNTYNLKAFVNYIEMNKRSNSDLKPMYSLINSLNENEGNPQKVKIALHQAYESMKPTVVKTTGQVLNGGKNAIGGVLGTLNKPII